MGKKRKHHEDIEELLQRPFCYYCERDFEDLRILIAHQKAKHFKCERCGRRLNTAGGLVVHMNQVHKEQLSQVENALPNRQGLEIEIFGMEGIPEDVLNIHRQRVIQAFYEAEDNRRIATGNPPPGTVSGSAPKKSKLETAEERKARLKEFVAKRQAEKAAGIIPGNGVNSPNNGLPQHSQPLSFGQPPVSYAGSPQTFAPFAQPPFNGHPQAPYGQPSYSPPQNQQFPVQGGPPFSGPPGHFQPSFPGGPSPPFQRGPYQAPPQSGPPRQGSFNQPHGLPQRPPAGRPYDGPSATADSVDDLISSVKAEVDAKPAAAEAKAASKKKGARPSKCVYNDTISPEEKMSQLLKYAFTPPKPGAILGEVTPAVTGTVGPVNDAMPAH